MGSISKKLKRLRQSHKPPLTMKQAAKLIGVPETTYREWEYGRAIRGEPYLQIAKAYGVSLEYLLGPVDESKDSIEDDFDKLLSDLSRLKEKVSKGKS